MTGIAGVIGAGHELDVDRMLDRIAHRGAVGRQVISLERAAFGVVWNGAENREASQMAEARAVWDRSGPGHFARAQEVDGRPVLMRDVIGVCPLYYGRTDEGNLCFASEVKAVLAVTTDVHELPPGYLFDGTDFRRYAALEPDQLLTEAPSAIASRLHSLLLKGIEDRIGDDSRIGSWLSGGLDSSVMASMAAVHCPELHTFSAGVDGAPDLAAADKVATHIGSIHHEVVVEPDDMIAVLPRVICHLESFDALLVRSSIMNYIVSEVASRTVQRVLSGEGADELFAGYEYLNSMEPAAIPSELMDITNRLHNTALQRVDRCASAHGTKAYVGFLDPRVVGFSMRIPHGMKLRNGVAKWILREAVREYLPLEILLRTKSKFWQGSGVGEQLFEYASHRITNSEFVQERNLPDGSQLKTIEELLYYRVFKELFGDANNIAWVGRTKGAPRTIDR